MNSLRARKRRLPARSAPGEGLGSGFSVHASGYILTDNRVIQGSREAHGLTSTSVQLELTLIACDPAFDLAIP